MLAPKLLLLCVLSLSCFYAANSFSYTNTIAQTISHQAHAKSNLRKGFTSFGKIQIEDSSLPIFLKWNKAADYELKISNINSSFTGFFKNDLTGSWTLRRSGSACSLTINKKAFSCPPRLFFASILYSGSSAEIAQNLAKAGIVDPSDTVYKQSNSMDASTLRNKSKMTFKLGRNGSQPKAVVQLHTGSSQVLNNELFPSIEYEQLFLVPTAAFFTYLSDPHSIIAGYDLEMKKRMNRSSVQLPNKIWIYSNNASEIKSYTTMSYPEVMSKKAKLSSVSRSSQSVSELRDSLSSKGQKLLDSLLLAF